MCCAYFFKSTADFWITVVSFSRYFLLKHNVLRQNKNVGWTYYGDCQFVSGNKRFLYLFYVLYALYMREWDEKWSVSKMMRTNTQNLLFVSQFHLPRGRNNTSTLYISSCSNNMQILWTQISIHSEWSAPCLDVSRTAIELDKGEGMVRGLLRKYINILIDMPVKAYYSVNNR